MNKNDDKILLLKKQISDKKELLKGNTRFIPVTNCTLWLNGEKYNINTLQKDSLVEIIVQLNSLYLSAKELGNNILEQYTISGYKLAEWITDISSKLAILDRKSEENKLKQLEDKLDKLLSEDKRVELELNDIENFLK